jgi:hypothetical protein
VTGPEDPDSSELDALVETVRSRGYELMRARVGVVLEKKRSELETDIGAEQTAFDRGYIAALRMVITIPTILHEEISRTIQEQ